MDYVKMAALAQDAGFTHMAPLDPGTIQLKDQVRQMCAACGQYAKRWSCPPGCGTLEACEQRVAAFQKGILLQTVGELEDEFDGEGMMETEQLHKARFCRLVDKLSALPGKRLPLGAGCCTLCAECTYPDAPCRFPERMISSMEAWGLVVADVCRDNGLSYYYGKNTITYTSCILF